MIASLALLGRLLLASTPAPFCHSALTADPSSRTTGVGAFSDSLERLYRSGVTWPQFLESAQSRQDSGGARRKEELRIVLRGSAHRFDLDAAFGQQVQGGLAVHFDQLMPLLELRFFEASPDGIPAFAVLDGRHGHMDRLKRHLRQRRDGVV